MLGELIVKKAEAKELTQQDYSYAVNYLLEKGVDSRITRFFLALNSFGMSKREVMFLALALRDSGQKVENVGDVFEKHSTGGVGDATSIVLIPLLASMGYKTIKTTGRSLVYTNGSSDRFGAIPGFSVNLTKQQIKDCIDKTNACILSHAGKVCPADKLLFDIMETAKIESDINLLSASIISKKLASNAKVVLVDIKYGDAAVIKTYKDAKNMAAILKYVFEKCGIEITVAITNTLQTIGEGIGNAIEVVDGLKVLQGRHCFLRRVVSRYAAEMMINYDKKLSKATAYEMIDHALDSGKAYQKFLDIVEAQGGDLKLVAEAKLFRPQHSTNFVADREGYVSKINSKFLGDLIRTLCSDNHDNHIGIALRVKIGDYVRAGDVIVSFYYRDGKSLFEYRDKIAESIKISENKVRPIRVLKKVIR